MDERNELRDQGYTVVKMSEPELMDDLREVIHLSEQAEGPTKGYTASMLLGRHPVVDRVATLPKILALTEVSVGKGMRAGQFIGSIKEKECPLLASMQTKTGCPLPFLNIIFCSLLHSMRRHDAEGRHHHRKDLKASASSDERRAGKSSHVPIEVEKGSVAVWDGSVTLRRSNDRDCTVLHATYQRLYTQPIDDYGIS